VQFQLIWQSFRGKEKEKILLVAGKFKPATIERGNVPGSFPIPPFPKPHSPHTQHKKFKNHPKKKKRNW
jgi:hypothetical protein